MVRPMSGKRRVEDAAPYESTPVVRPMSGKRRVEVAAPYESTPSQLLITITH